MQAMLELRQGDDLADAYMEAWQRGPSWREAITRSLRTYDEDLRAGLRDGLAASIADLGGDPALYGLRDDG